MPLLPGDEIQTGDNGQVTIAFPDGTETVINKNQRWSSSEYTPGVGIQSISLPVDPHWYYVSLENALS